MDLLTILFLVFTVILFISLVVLFLAAGQEPMPPQNLIDFPVSVIIAAHNAGKNLKQLIENLYRQHYSNFEVIIVDDRSDEKNRNLLEEVKSEFPSLRSIRIEETPPNIDAKKYALSLGIKAAKYDIILLTDSDCLPSSPTWISGMASGFDDNTQIILGFSDYRRYPGLLNYFIRFETIFTAIQYMGSALLGNPYMGVGRNIAYKKAFFLKEKGFSGFQKVVGGDDDLFVNKRASRRNTAVVMGKDFTTISEPKSSIRDYLRQKVRHLSAGRQYKLKDKIILGLFNSGYLGSLLVTLLLMIRTPALIWLASFLLVRWILMMIVIGRWSKLLGYSFRTIGVPLLDILYLFYYIFTGTKALFTKKVKWT